MRKMELKEYPEILRCSHEREGSKRVTLMTAKLANEMLLPQLVTNSKKTLELEKYIKRCLWQ